MRAVLFSLAACAAISVTANAATVVKTVDPAAPWTGFMNVSETPENGGAYLWGSGWGTADLRASFSGPTLTLQANNIGDPAEYWYVGGGALGNPGNKVMDASFYVDGPTGVTNGDTLVFSGIVLANTFVSGYTSVAFIKDFAPDYSSFVSSTVALTPGAFSVSLATIPMPGRHIQYGFETIGKNAWGTDADAKGSAIVIAPEPTSLAALAVTGLMLRRRR